MTSLVLTRWRIVVLSAALSLLIGALVFQPLAVHYAESAARQRGWSVIVGHATLGARGVWLKAIRVTRDRVPGLEVRIDAIRVPWSKVFTRDGFVVIGGSVLLPDNLDSLREELSPNSQAKRTSKSSRWSLSVSGLDLRWPSKEPNGTSLSAWGLSGNMAGEKGEFWVDRVEAFHKQSVAVLTRATLVLEKSNVEWKLTLAKIEQARIAIQNRDADTHAPKQEPGDAIHKLTIAMTGIQSGVGTIRGLIARHLSSNGVVEIPSIGLKLSLGAQSLNVGPFQLQARSEVGRFAVKMEQGSMGTDERRYFELHIPASASHIDLKGEIGFVSLQALGVKDSDFGLAHVDSAKLRLNLTSSIDEVASKATLAVAGELLDVSLNQRWLASRTVTGINAEFSGSGEVGWDSGLSLRVSELSLKLGQARADITAELRRVGEETQAKLDVNVPLAACNALIESLPTGLAPLASQVKLEGTLALQAGIVFDTAHPNRTDAKWDLANGCRVRGSSREVAPERFREPFILDVPDARGVMVERAFGPGTPNWVPLSTMNAHLVDAILVCEDGRFFSHTGFDSQAIRASIKDNFLRGKFMRGGSTVSMQLAKNLYLRREKTVSRKLQEAVFTLLLEQSFSKNDIMELYFNVVELGPGIYGVGDASKFYFDTTPADLSTTQAFYLASVLPNPKVLHFAPDGKISRGWLNQVRRLLTIAHGRHYLTDDELQQSIEEELHFGSSVGNHPPAPALESEQGDPVPDGPSDG